MNYLHHASKHISSSHSLSGKKTPVRFSTVLIYVIVLLVIYLLFGNMIAGIVFGIRNSVAPSREVSITLTPHAYDARISALEIENDSLKGLLLSAGITLPKGNEPLDDSELISRQRIVSLGSTLVSGGQLGMQTDVASDISESGVIQTADVCAQRGIAQEEGGTATSTTSTICPPIDASPDLVQEVRSAVPISLMLKGNEVIASVLVRPPQSPYDALIVNVGSAEGVSVGDQVYAFTGFPIGTVIDVQDARSTIQLLSAPGMNTEVLIGTSTNAVMAEGRGGGNFFLKLPKITDIKKGDVVTRSYLPLETLSTIETVDSKEGEAYIYAYFKLPIHLNSLVYVLIKKNFN